MFPTVFNLAIFLLSPIAGSLIENTPVKRVLNVTTSLRAFLYVIVIPGLWVLLRSGWIIPVEPEFFWVFYGTFTICIFVDGICVTFSNIVDIDCGGTQLIAHQVCHSFSFVKEVYFDISRSMELRLMKSLTQDIVQLISPFSTDQ